MRLPIVAIVGRANVGKSTLFNRIIEEPKALVSPIPGTTRDIQTAETNWRDKTFTLSDTGGLDVDHKEEIETKVRVQAEKAIEKARVIIFVVDVRDGLMPQDRVLAESLKRGKKPVIFVANKVDSAGLRAVAADREWLKLGFGAPHTISATTGIGVGDLLDVVAGQLEKPGREREEPTVKIAMIGRPNVGKSSLLNAILGEERFITSATPHTTREPVDTLIYYTPDPETKVPILLIDTAGIRRRARVEKGLESAGVRRSLEMVRRTDVILFVVDLSEPVTAQDKNLASLIAEERKALIVIANKWDLIRDKKTKMALDK
jgi:GTP-binding protein